MATRQITLSQFHSYLTNLETPEFKSREAHECIASGILDGQPVVISYNFITAYGCIRDSDEAAGIPAD